MEASAGPQHNHDVLVSVVIPTHNRSELLARAINNAQGQTYGHLEIIVVDDASSDNTREVVSSFHDKRIRYIRHDTNKGGSAARNSGIQEAKGRIIAFLDDDDEWEPNKTELQLASMEYYDATVCASDGISETVMKQLVTNKSFELNSLRRGMPPYGGGTSALMAHASLMKNILFDEKLPRCQDWDVLIRLAERGKVGFLRERLVRYNDGNHLRISTARLKDSNNNDQERWLLFFNKHRLFFGERLYQWHAAAAMLYGVRHRKHRLQYISGVAKRYGLTAVMIALWERIWQYATGNG